MTRALLAAVLTAVLLPCSALAAASEDYRGCDGYGAAGGSGDGMTSMATVGLIFSPPGYGNTDRADTGKNAAAAIAGCDAALAELAPKFWMRKVSLLRARALHRMAMGDLAAAKTDLDLADAAVQPADAFYDRSLGWGLAMTRAYWMIRNGDRDGGEALAMQTVARRPWNRQTVASAISVVGSRASDANRRLLLRDISRLMPSRLTLLYLDAYDQRDYAQVIALHEGLVPNLDASQTRSEAEQATLRWRNFRTAQSFSILTGGMYAYALAATGRNADARAAITASREALGKATQPPAALSDRDARDREKAALHDGDVQIRARVAAEEGKVLDSWSSQIEMRIAVSEGHVDQVIAAMPKGVLPQDMSTVELLDATMEKLPLEQRPPRPLSAELRLMLGRQEKPYAFKDTQPQALLAALPEAETTRRLTPYEPVSFSIFGVPDEGFRASAPNPDGSITVSFRGDQTSTSSMVEEMVLLRAVEMARLAGKKGLVLLDRSDVRNSLVTTMYGVPMRSDPNGYLCALTVLFVDPAAPPGIVRDAAWRVLDADAIYAELAPIYIPDKKRK